MAAHDAILDVDPIRLCRSADSSKKNARIDGDFFGRGPLFDVWCIGSHGHLRRPARNGWHTDRLCCYGGWLLLRCYLEQCCQLVDKCPIYGFFRRAVNIFRTIISDIFWISEQLTTLIQCKQKEIWPFGTNFVKMEDIHFQINSITVRHNK